MTISESCKGVSWASVSENEQYIVLSHCEIHDSFGPFQNWKRFKIKNS